MVNPVQPFYGAPYYDNDYWYNDGSSPTVEQQVQNDWLHYQKYWGVSPYGPLHCTYTFTPAANGDKTGYFGGIQWQGDCGGGDGIYGTKQCPKGYKLEGGKCVSTAPYEVSLSAGPVEIPLFTDVKNGRVLTRSFVRMYLTKNGQPVPGMSVPLESDRGTVDSISNDEVTNAGGEALAYVSTRNQPGSSTITSSSATIETAEPADIPWLPAQYQNSFLLTCYVVSLESNFLNTKMVTAPGIQGKKYHLGFLRDTEMQGTGEALDGSYIHYESKRDKFEPVACPVTREGACAIDGVTAAVDPEKIPLKSTISISSVGERTALDTGGGIGGYHIDLFFGTRRQACLQLGRSHGHTVTLQSYGN